MSTKTLGLFASILTAILCLVAVVALTFMQLVALNGFSDREGGLGLAAALAFEVAGLILAALLARRLTRRLTDRSNWNRFPAAAVGVFAGLLLGTVFGGLGFAAAVIVAQAIRGS